MIPHSDCLGFPQNLDDQDWNSCPSTSPSSDSVSAYSSFNFLGPVSDYRNLWLSPGVHDTNHHTEPLVDYFSLDFPSKPTELPYQENSYADYNTIDDSLYCQLGQSSTPDSHLNQSPNFMSKSSPFDEETSPFSEQMALSTLSSPGMEETEALSMDSYHSMTNPSGIGRHQSISTNSLVSANESPMFQNETFDPIYDSNFHAYTPESRDFVNPMVQTHRSVYHTQYHEPAGFKCGWVGCKLIGKFGSEASLIRHIRSVHISPRSFKCLVPSCRMPFKRRDELSHHIRRRHRGPLVNKSALDVRSMIQSQT